MKIAQLSAVILTNRNDERFLNALKSVQFAEEIIIIDNNSNNDWKVLKEKYQIKVIDHSEKITDFSKPKNEVLKEINTQWVLFLDSDEILSDEADQQIKEIINQDLFDAISIKRIDYYLNKPLMYGETSGAQFIRLFKKNMGKFSRNVHEKVDYDGKVGEANFQILHYSHNSIKDFLEKITSYALLDSKEKRLTKNEAIIQMITFPIGKFLLNYFFKLGFLDGYRGIVYAVVMSLHSFFVRVYYYENA